MSTRTFAIIRIKFCDCLFEGSLCKKASNHHANLPLVLMTRHFDYFPSASEGDNQSVKSSAPVVSRCFPGGYNVKLYISRGRLAWRLLAFLCCGYMPFLALSVSCCFKSLLLIQFLFNASESFTRETIGVWVLSTLSLAKPEFHNST